MRVDFILIGAQKSGTTSLASQLAAHPQVCFSKVKEPGYFNETDAWEAGLAEYHSLYNPLPGQICGEGSTMYTFLPEWLETAQRLYQYNPNLKLIYMMRQPVKRIISHYTHNLVRSIEKNDPQTAVLKDPRYINRSRYAVQLRPYIELFGSEKILLLVFEEYIAAQEAILRQVAQFLGISSDAFADTDTTPKHKSIGTPYLKSPSVEKWVGSDIFQAVRAIVPASIRQPIRYRFFSNRLDRAPEFTLGLKQLLWQFLADDVASIEHIKGRRIDSWHEGFPM